MEKTLDSTNVEVMVMEEPGEFRMMTKEELQLKIKDI